MVASALSVSKGVSTIEPMNKVVVPILLGIVLFSVYWAIFLPYAQVGIEHYFTPNWGKVVTNAMCEGSHCNHVQGTIILH